MNVKLFGNMVNSWRDMCIPALFCNVCCNACRYSDGVPGIGNIQISQHFFQRPRSRSAIPVAD